jgi:hypothetical protein
MKAFYRTLSGGLGPSNVIKVKTETSQGAHSAPFPRALVEFFIKAFPILAISFLTHLKGTGQAVAFLAGAPPFSDLPSGFIEGGLQVHAADQLGVGGQVTANGLAGEGPIFVGCEGQGDL